MIGLLGVRMVCVDSEGEIDKHFDFSVGVSRRTDYVSALTAWQAYVSRLTAALDYVSKYSDTASLKKCCRLPGWLLNAGIRPVSGREGGKINETTLRRRSSSCICGSSFRSDRYSSATVHKTRCNRGLTVPGFLWRNCSVEDAGLGLSGACF
jgi:hypothetical protein